MDKFEDMVEDLELNEDMVECKECFDLFPKADCIKQEHGYICPTCGRIGARFDREIASPDITTGLYDQEFPDVADYAPGTTKDWGKEATVTDALDALLADEVEAIDGYEEAEEVIEASDREDKKEILDTIEHIKEEEEEHIDELKDHCPECKVPEEADLEEEEEEEVDEALSLGGGIAAAGAAIGAGMIGSKLLDSKKAEEGSEDLDELFDANVNLALDGGEGNDVSVLSSHKPEKKGEEELNELFDANVSLSVDGGDNNDVDVLSPLNASHDERKGEEDLTESKGSRVYIASSLESGEIVAACYANSEVEAIVKLEQAFTERTGLMGSELEDCFIELADDTDLEILTPDDFVTESLSEQMLTEAPFGSKDKVDIATKLFKQGFILRILDVEARTGDKTAYKTYADAEKAAKAAAKRFPNAQVYVLAKPVSDLEAAEKTMLNDFIKSSEFPMFKDKQWVLLGYKGGKTTLDYMSSMQKKFVATLKSQKKLDKALGKATPDAEETIPDLRDDDPDTVDTEETSDRTEPETVEEPAETEPAVTRPAGTKNKEKNKQIKIALLKALIASGVTEAEAKATVLKLKDNIMFQLRKDILGESLNEDLRTTEEATTELKDTESALKDAALSLKNMTSAMREEYHKYANPTELKVMEDLEAIIDAAKNDALSSMQNWGIDISETDSQGWMSGNSEYTYQFMLDYDGIDEDEEEDVQDQLQNMIENAVLSKYTLPPELSDLSISVMLPDPDLSDDDWDDEEDEGAKRASLLVEVTFARNLI